MRPPGKYRHHPLRAARFWLADVLPGVLIILFVSAFILACLLFTAQLLMGAVEYNQEVTTTTEADWRPGGYGGVKPE